MSETTLPPFLSLTPRYFPRVWGGERLAPPMDGVPIGEAWIADGHSLITGGPLSGLTINEVMHTHPEALLGPYREVRGGFPLLIKLLDCQGWLSVQVHPNDEQAREMVGPMERGKTEAWHFLRVESGAALLAGVTPTTTPNALADAIWKGGILELIERHEPTVGDTLFIPAGTLHALGPGLLVYEVQQASDITYRVYDWDRPASAGRALHLQESVQVTRADLRGQWQPARETGGVGDLVRCALFTLRGARGEETVDTGHRCAVVTAVDATVTLVARQGSLKLDTFGTVLVPAATGPFQVWGSGRVLIATPN